MTKEEIIRKRLSNQYLQSPVSTERVVKDLCGIQAQFFGNVIHSLKLRSNESWGKGDGLVKNWTLRGTMHVFSEADLPLFLRCGDKYRRNEWAAKSFWNQRSDWALTPERQKALSDVILQAVTEKDRSREELKQRCREFGMTEAEEASMFHPWGGGIRELCERGFLHYAAREEKVFCLSPVVEPVALEKAELELARRYFTNFAPATIHDAMCFFKVPASQIKKWLAQLPVTAAVWDGKTYYSIENGKTPEREIPECLFLAGFDQLMLGYEKKESLYLKPENLRDIYNLAGIVTPALLINSEVVGKWKEKDGCLTVTPFRGLSAREMSAMKDNAEHLWPQLRKLKIEA